MTLARDESPSEVDKSTCISTDATIEGIPVAGLKNEVDVTEHQIQDRRELPRRADRLTLPIVVVIAVGGLERAAYYAVTVPWQNYIQNSSDHDAGSPPGALGLGQATATAITSSYMVFTALMPMPAALVADLWLGRYWTLVISIIFSASGCLIQLITSIPTLSDGGGGAAGIALSMLLVGAGAGGVKAVFSPFLGDQYNQKDDREVEGKHGKREIVDCRLTLQLIYNIFYAITNFASLSIIPATFLERTHGFWATFTLATSCIVTALLLLLATSSRLVKVVHGQNDLLPAAKVMKCAIQNGFNMERTKSSHQLLQRGKINPWTDSFVDEVSATLHTCRVLLSFVVFYLCVNQMSNNLISQAGQMKLSGLPNDMVPSFAAIACVILAPVLQTLWGSLARRRIMPSAIFLIALSFLICGVSIGYASLNQHLIYISPPCYNRPGKCGVAAGQPNAISVWVQLPTYIIAAVAETIGFVTASEYAYSRSPANAKSVIQALSQVAAAIGSMLGLATSPAARDPWLVIYYGAMAGAMAVGALLFWLFFGNDWKRTEYNSGD